MFSFGGSTTAAPSTPFGASAAPATTSTPFGAASQPATGVGLFGSGTPAASAPAFRQPAATGTTGGTGLFGSSQPAQTGTTGLFGSTTTQQAGGTTGGLFGSATTQPAAGTSTGLFGSSGTTSSTGGGLFGSTAAAGGTGLFGSAGAAAPSGGTGLFGSNTVAPATGGLFGGSTPAPATGGLFGGAQTGGGLFGGASAAKPAFGGFGAASATQPSGGLFGSTASGAGALVPAAPAPPSNPCFVELGKVKTAYDDDANNAYYRFKFVFYSAIREDLLARLGPDQSLQDVLTEEPNWDDETRQLWNQAKAANPDSRRFIPDVVRGVSFADRPNDGLQGRINKQKARTQELKSCLETMERELAKIEDEHVLMRERVMQCKRAQLNMAQSVVEAVSLLESRQIRDRPLTQVEEQMLSTLDKIKRELASPTQYSARLLELQSQARALQQTMRVQSDQVELDAEDSAAVYKYLQQQQDALMALCNIVADDLEDVKIMADELAKWN